MIIRDNANQKLYNRNHEAQEMWRVTQPEIDGLFSEVIQIFENTRANLANLDGLEIWEKIYDIIPNLHTDSKEDRRERVLEMKRAQPPFTERWLQHELERRAVLAGHSPTSIRSTLKGLILELMYNNLPDAPRTHRELMPWIRGIIPADVMVLIKQYLEHQLPDIAGYTYAHTHTHVRHDSTPQELRKEAKAKVHGYAATLLTVVHGSTAIE